MPLEKSAGVVVFRREKEKIYYLLLHYPSSAKAERDYWDFPKGHLEAGENEIEAAKREVSEETGLRDIQFVEGFKEWIKYFFRFEGKNVFKIVTYFLAETKTVEIKVSAEHLGYQWLEYEPALAALTFKNAQGILKKADEFLKKLDRTV